MTSRFSLVALFGVTAYVAACCPVFVYPNLWWGTLVVAATIAAFILATTRAARAGGGFWLGFSIGGWAWLVATFGFYGQSDLGIAAWTAIDVWLKSLWWTVIEALPPPSSATNGSVSDPFGSFAQLHSIHVWDAQMVVGEAPLFHNFMRLVVCLSAVIVGFLVGLAFWAFPRRRRRADASPQAT